MSNIIIYALGLSLFAGLATGIGSLIAFFYKKTNESFLSFALGLSAGVMIYISFMELMFGAQVGITELTGSDKTGILYTAIAFFVGIAFVGLIDALIPEDENPHEMHTMDELRDPTNHHNRLKRTGLITALAIGVHNFPEGIATFVSALESPETGIAIAVAVAIHNIPEGVAVSVPVYAATGSKAKAFWLSFCSGLAEPIGAVLAWLILMPFLSPMMMHFVSAAVAGIMVFISLDELLPAAREYGKNHIALIGLISGMVIMALSLYFLA
ncbi:MAG: zinc transporter ZupT [Rikenellaceae bacterium]|jgi:ZIP family zinc transporter|nr:zinc transporter ZupT [Rikenellaceae bacterium]